MPVIFHFEFKKLFRDCDLPLCSCYFNAEGRELALLSEQTDGFPRGDDFLNVPMDFRIICLADFKDGDSQVRPSGCSY